MLRQEVAQRGSGDLRGPIRCDWRKACSLALGRKGGCSTPIVGLSLTASSCVELVKKG